MCIRDRVATAVICTFEGFEYIYRQSVITRQTAVIQNEAVLIAAEYSNYESLEAAENNDMNSRLSSYSALNQIRIRIVNLNYWINNYKCRVVQQIVIDYTK